MSAITLWRLVVVRREAAGDERLMRHEMAHVRQWLRLGVVRFLVHYLGDYLRWRLRGCGHWEAYRRIPLEVEAEREAASADGHRDGAPVRPGTASWPPVGRSLEAEGPAG